MADSSFELSADHHCGNSVASDAAPTFPHSHSTRLRLQSVAAGGLMGGAVLSLVVPLERLAFHPQVYAGVGDFLLHLACRVVVCSAACLILYTSFWGLFVAPARWVRWSPHQVLAVSGCIAGAAAGVLAYWLMVYETKRWNLSGQPVLKWFALLSLCVLGAIALPGANLAYRRWPRLVVAAILSALLGIIRLDLHRYLRLYGTFHLLLELVSVLAFGFLGAQLALRMRPALTLRISLAILAVCATGAVALLKFAPSAGARLAILRYGGIERSIVRHVLWPLFDRDGDGFPQRFWGSDCNDSNPGVNPLEGGHDSPFIGCGTALQRRVKSSTIDAPQHQATPRNLVWIIIDTLRSDVLDRHYTKFPGFTRFPNYRSCGGSTLNVLLQIFGGQGCRPKVPVGSLIDALNSAGHDSSLFLTYEVPQDPDYQSVFRRFVARKEATTDQELLQIATEWIRGRERSSRPHFTVVHLWGAHLPMGGRGQPSNTEATDFRLSARARYDALADGALEMVSDFVTRLPTDDFVIVMGDHGEEFQEHDGATHGQTLYEEILRTPLMMRGAQFTPNSSTCIFSCADLVSVAFSVATGNAAPVSVCSESGPPLLAAVGYPLTARGPKSTQQRSLYLADSRKVIWDLNLDAWELYDIARDPTERTNLADTHPELLQAAADELRSAMVHCSQ